MWLFSSIIQQLEQKQALARQLADLLHFTLKFDKRKMENAQLQNDYSFFRLEDSNYLKLLFSGVYLPLSIKRVRSSWSMTRSLIRQRQMIFPSSTLRWVHSSDPTSKISANANAVNAIGGNCCPVQETKRRGPTENADSSRHICQYHKVHAWKRRILY